MRLLVLLILAIGSPVRAQLLIHDQVDCKTERTTLLKSIKPMVQPNATLESKEDKDPSTVEFFFVKDLPIEQSHVSEDGQVIYISSAATDDGVGAKLFAAAIDRLLELKIGKVCPPTQISESGT